MSVKIDIKMLGLKELEDALKELRDEMTKRGEAGKEGNIVKNAIGYAARDVKDKMVFLAPQSDHGSNIDWHKSKNGRWVHGGPFGELAPPGRLKRSIFVKYEKRPRLSEVVYVGPRIGDSRNDPDGAWYAAIVEMHGGAGGKGKGYMRNSITPAFHTKMIAQRLAAGINRVAKRIGHENLQKVASKYLKK